MVHEALGLFDVQAVDTLLVAGGTQREQGQDLGLTTGEETGAVRPRSDADFAADRPDLVHAAAVGTLLVDGDGLADVFLLHCVERLGDTAPLRRSDFLGRAVGRPVRGPASCLRAARASARSCLSSTFDASTIWSTVARFDLVHDGPVGQLSGRTPSWARPLRQPTRICRRSCFLMASWATSSPAMMSASSTSSHPASTMPMASLVPATTRLTGLCSISS